MSLARLCNLVWWIDILAAVHCAPSRLSVILLAIGLLGLAGVWSGADRGLGTIRSSRGLTNH